MESIANKTLQVVTIVKSCFLRLL